MTQTRVGAVCPTDALSSRPRRLVSVAIACAAATAAAQPTGPGQLEREFTAPPAARPAEGPTVPATPDQQPPADADKVRFRLSGVELAGNTAVSTESLMPHYGPMLGREVSLADVFRLADTLTQAYRNAGYVLSRVVVPPQNIRDGVVRLQVVEGHVAQARAQGVPAGSRAPIERHLQAVQASRPLAASVLERELLLVNDLPGVSARATLAPSATPQASDLTLDVSQQRFAASAALNNRGSRSLGPWRIDASLDAYGLLGPDRLGARAIRTVPDDEMTFVVLSYEHVLGAGGARVGLNLSGVEADPGGAQNLNLPTRSRSATLHGSYPWLRSRALNVHLRASLSVLRSETELLVAGVPQPFSDDRISAVRLGASVDAADRFRGVSVLDVEVSRGIDAFDASKAGDPELSVAGGRPQFNKLTLYAARLQSIAPRWSLLAALNAQYAPHTLLSPERFAFGGEHFGRAYDSAELTGDSGAALKGELRFTDSAGGWLRDYTLYAFYEAGRVHRRNAVPGQPSRESATDAGVGLRWSAQRHVSGYLEVSKPLTRDVAQEGDRDPRVFVGVQGSL